MGVLGGCWEDIGCHRPLEICLSSLRCPQTHLSLLWLPPIFLEVISKVGWYVVCPWEHIMMELYYNLLILQKKLRAVVPYFLLVAVKFLHVRHLHDLLRFVHLWGGIQWMRILTVYMFRT